MMMAKGSYSENQKRSSPLSPLSFIGSWVSSWGLGSYMLCAVFFLFSKILYPLPVTSGILSSKRITVTSIIASLLSPVLPLYFPSYGPSQAVHG